MLGTFEGVADADGVVVATDVEDSLLDGAEVDDSWSSEVVVGDIEEAAEDDELVESVVDASTEVELEESVGESEVEICEPKVLLPAPEPVVIIERVVNS